MKAVLMRQVGGPEVLQYTEIAKPKIKHKTEICVQIKGAGINPVDTKQRGRGTWYPSEPPQILGIDGAGIVEETGTAVKRFKTGDHVYFAHGGIGKGQGNYAEYTVMEELFAAIMPESLSFIEAAAAPSSMITAWESMFERGGLQEGQSVLIHGGAGGVGHIAVQLAKAKGARVCTTVIDSGQKKVAEDLGADRAIIYNESDFVKETNAWTEGRGVDVALDLVGGETFFKTFSCVRFYGNVVALLRPEPKYTDWMEARLRNLNICFELMPTPIYYDLKERQRHHTLILEECARIIDAGKLKILIRKTYPLRKAAQAHRILEKGRTIGKIVLIPG